MCILIVEDEVKVGRTVALGLKAEHYAVDTAKDELAERSRCQAGRIFA
jgi:DNA-binding response OmpR family regulator